MKVVITFSFLFTLFRRKSGPVALDPVPITSSMSDEEETVFTVSIPLHLLPLKLSTSYSLNCVRFHFFRCIQVSIPLQIFSVGPVPNLSALRRRVESLSVLPACKSLCACIATLINYSNRLGDHAV